MRVHVRSGSVVLRNGVLKIVPGGPLGSEEPLVIISIIEEDGVRSIRRNGGSKTPLLESGLVDKALAEKPIEDILTVLLEKEAASCQRSLLMQRL